MNKSILVVEDDPNLGFLLAELLATENYRVKVAKDGMIAWNLLQSNRYDLCLLDIMMPRMDGFTLAQKIRTQGQPIPFIFLTAKSLKADKLRGYDFGADDYVTKPFDEDELLCKIKAILRRLPTNSSTSPSTESFQIGDFEFDYSLRELSYKDGTSKRLTEKESEVLRLLCLHKNQILRRDEAVEKIYGKRDYFLGRSFDVFISKIRKMLALDTRIRIENVFKVGFILKVE